MKLAKVCDEVMVFGGLHDGVHGVVRSVIDCSTQQFARVKLLRRGSSELQRAAVRDYDVAEVLVPRWRCAPFDVGAMRADEAKQKAERLSQRSVNAAAIKARKAKRLQPEAA